MLSVALTPEKAMGELSCRGYVALRAGSIAEIGLTLVRKAAEEDPGYWEIVGIPIGDFDAEQDFAIALAKAAEEPVLVPGRRRRE